MNGPIVTVYTSPSCAACVMTKRHLNARNIFFSEVSISSDERIVSAVNELGFSTAPVVCASTPAGEQCWDGYRPDRIDALVAS